MTGAKTSFRLSLFWQWVTVRSAIVTQSYGGYWLTHCIHMFPCHFPFAQTFANAQCSYYTTHVLIQFWGSYVCEKEYKIRHGSKYLFRGPPRALKGAHASEGPMQVRGPWSLSFICFMVNPTLMPPQHFIGGTQENHGKLRFEMGTSEALPRERTWSRQCKPLRVQINARVLACSTYI